MVDDNADDRFLLRRAFLKAGVINPILEAKSGREAIAYLNGEGEYADRDKFPLPSILLLDLHMPGTDGFGVLQWVRDKFTTGSLLIVVLSRLDEIKSINRAYALGANSFLTKPGNPEEVDALIKSFHDYWMLRNNSPQTDSSSAAKKRIL